MAGWRDHLRRGRRDVHTHMLVPAVYVKAAGQAPQRVNVRVHTRFATVQPDAAGAALMDTTPRLIFDRTEVSRPLKHGTVAVSETEVYCLDMSRPPNPDFITINVSELSEAEAAVVWQPEWQDLLV